MNDFMISFIILVIQIYFFYRAMRTQDRQEDRIIDIEDKYNKLVKYHCLFVEEVDKNINKRLKLKKS